MLLSVILKISHCNHYRILAFLNQKCNILPAAALHAPFEGTTPMLAVLQEEPEHLQVDAVSPATKTGGTALFRHASTVLPAVHNGLSPHMHWPVSSDVVHLLPVWDVVPQSDDVPHWQEPAPVVPVGTHHGKGWAQNESSHAAQVAGVFDVSHLGVAPLH